MALVQAPGLRLLSKALAEAGSDGEWTAELKRINAEAAGKIYAEARTRASTPQQREAVKSLRVGGGAGSASLRLGGRGKPGVFALGAEFGSKQYKQFPSWRGNRWTKSGPGEGTGYFLYPSIRAQADEVQEEYAKAIDRLFREAFPT